MKSDWTVDQVCLWIATSDPAQVAETDERFSWVNHRLGDLPTSTQRRPRRPSSQQEKVGSDGDADDAQRLADVENASSDHASVEMTTSEIQAELLKALKSGRVTAYWRGNAVGRHSFTHAHFAGTSQDGLLRLLLDGEKLHEARAWSFDPDETMTVWPAKGTVQSGEEAAPVIVVDPAPSQRRGRGRPNHQAFIQAQLERRLIEGASCESIADETDVILKLFERNSPEEKPPAAGTVKKKVSAFRKKATKAK